MEDHEDNERIRKYITEPLLDSMVTDDGSHSYVHDVFGPDDPVELALAKVHEARTNE